ncbi:hypothetical protein SDC9_186023 [bioreactor metagenome]|uniref:Uncharacterized protein n=1 Tax=bioreactor metagenome TaxID=1076179 RepID=A0A645HJX8_9ZZZZ
MITFNDMYENNIGLPIFLGFIEADIPKVLGNKEAFIVLIYGVKLCLYTSDYSVP